MNTTIQTMGLLKQLLKIAATVLVLSVFAESSALTLGKRSLQDSLIESDIAVVGRIQSVETQFVDKTECGTKYTAFVSTRLKDQTQTPEKSIVSFGRFPGLNPGREYLLLLNYVRSSEEMLNNISDVVSRSESDQQNIKLIECNGIVPGYYFDRSKAWEVSGENVLLTERPPRGLLRKHARRINFENKVVWSVNKNYLVHYLKKVRSAK